MVRIISGYFKGHLIKTNQNPLLRPTSDRVKESLFSILGNLDKRRVIDLFAGSGNLGLEAISRGAESCIMVENNAQQIRLIEENVSRLGIEDAVRIVKNDVRRFLKEPPETDLILADPPYNYPYFNELLNLLIGKFKAATIALEAGKQLVIPGNIQDCVQSQRLIGETSLTIMRV